MTFFTCWAIFYIFKYLCSLSHIISFLNLSKYIMIIFNLGHETKKGKKCSLLNETEINKAYTYWRIWFSSLFGKPIHQSQLRMGTYIVIKGGSWAVWLEDIFKAENWSKQLFSPDFNTKQHQITLFCWFGFACFELEVKYIDWGFVSSSKIMSLSSRIHLKKLMNSWRKHRWKYFSCFST